MKSHLGRHSSRPAARYCPDTCPSLDEQGLDVIDLDALTIATSKHHLWYHCTFYPSGMEGEWCDRTAEAEAIEQQMLVWSNKKKKVWIYCDSCEPPTQSCRENTEARGAKEEGVGQINKFNLRWMYGKYQGFTRSHASLKAGDRSTMFWYNLEIQWRSEEWQGS